MGQFSVGINSTGLIRIYYETHGLHRLHAQGFDVLALKHKSNELATIDHIAAAYGISRNHLMKIVHAMGQHGMVETLRGRMGGIRLARPPEQITLGEIVRLGEEDFAMVECQTPGQEQNCAVWQACNLKRSFRSAVEAFMRELDRVTLADAVTAPLGMQSLLGVNSEGKRMITITSVPSQQPTSF